MAADMTVVCSESSACLISGADPLFTTTADGVWYPGRTLTRTINMKNNGTQVREMALKGTGMTVSDILKNVMNLSLINSGGAVIWSGSLADFYNQNNINLGIFNPGDSLDYKMTINMNNSANDDYQEKESVFDLTLGFLGEPIAMSGVLGEKAPGELGGAIATQEGQINSSNWWRLTLTGAGGITFIFFGFQLIKFFMKGGEK